MFAFISSAENEGSTSILSNSSNQMSPDDVILQLTDEQMSLAVTIVNLASCVILVVALPMTISNMAVFLHKSMQSATSTYVLALNTAQLLYLLNTAAITFLDIAVPDRLNNYDYLFYTLYFGVYSRLVARKSSNVLMCVISVERLHAVLLPLHSRNFVLVRHPVKTVLITALVVALWNAYLPIRIGIVAKQGSDGRISFAGAYSSLYFQNRKVFEAVGVSAEICLEYLTLAVLLILNVVTIWALRSHVTAMRGMQVSEVDEGNKRRERQLTRTILGVTIAYVILSLPIALHGLLGTVVHEYGVYRKYSNLFLVVRAIVLALTELSCVTEFLCFFVLSSRFRSVLRRHFRTDSSCWKIKKVNDSDDVSTWTEATIQ